jgi:PKD repeat protein
MQRQLMALGLLVACAASPAAQTNFQSFGPLNEWHYPSFYEDHEGTRLVQMVDQNDPFSGIPPEEFLVGTPVISTDPNLSNFFHESFYWFSNAFLTVPALGDAELIMALEGAFGNLDESLRDGDQTVFSRLRIRLRGDAFEAGFYRITTPMGVFVFDAPAVEPGRRIINSTVDCLHVFLPPGGPTVICGTAPFGPNANYFTTPLGVLDDGTLAPQYSPNGPNFLRWDPAVLPLAPAGYLGDPAIPHRVTGAAGGNQNLFKIEFSRTSNFGTIEFTAQTDLFSVMGKISDEVVDPCASVLPTAEFGASPLSGNRPLNVTFTDLSTCATSWSWDFGDGSGSTTQSPSHIYTAAGTYTVSLTVEGPGGSDSITKTNLISVTEPPPPPGNDLVLAPPTPGTAGVPNTLVVTNCTPNRTVGVYAGLVLGSTVVRPGSCSTGITLGLARPFRLLGTTTANAAGVATLIVTPPASSAGKVFHFQAAEPATCRKSNLVSDQL